MEHKVSEGTLRMNHPIEWVKLAKYVELTGDSADAVHGRRRLGKWKDGEHCKVADGSLWVNLTNVEKWLEEYGTVPKSAYRSV